MDFVGAIKAGFKNYVNFRGTATLPEYWYWVLFTFLVSLVISFDPTGSLGAAFSLFTLLPSLGVLVRRLRDAGFSWTWLLLPLPGLIALVALITNVILLIMSLGINQIFLNNPELIDEDYLREMIMSPEFLNPTILIFFSFLYVILTYVLVNVIFPIRKSKSFEEGNKRVAPKTPENPAI